jgi:beta-glucosidase
MFHAPGSLSAPLLSKKHLANSLQPFWGSGLQSAIGSGVASTRLDDMVKRILASWYLTKQDSGYPSIAVTARGGSGQNVQGNHSLTARAVARDGIVLLKNAGNLLPLQKPKSIGSGAVANPKGINSCVDNGCDQGTLVQGWGSGTATLPVSSLTCPSLRIQTLIDG